MTEHFDGIIIGAGQAGGPLSTALANAGWRVAMVEREHAGGTCVNEGCTPTKLMAATARVAYLARRAPDYGINTGEVTVNMTRIRERKRDIVESWRSGSRNSIEGTEGVTYIEGEAQFADAHTLEITLNAGGTQQITGEHIFINTGQRPSTLPIEGLDEVPVLTNKSIMELAEVPDHLVVIGGGYVGLEFGQMFRRFGAAVTIIEASEDFLPREDRDIAQAVRDILAEDGITIYTNAQTTHLSQTEGGIQLTANHGGEDLTVEGSHLLLAVGRTPNTDRLNLGAAGVETKEHGYIRTNAKLQTTVPHIYALGDVKGGPAFTHISYDDFRVVRTNLIGGGDASIEGRVVPYTVFIDPQLAHVGLHESEAEEQGLNYRVTTLPMERVARAIEMNETRGMMKALVDAETGHILGATILGVEGGEVMTVLQMAMMGSVPYTALRDGVFAHPLLSESLNNLFMGLDA